MGDGGLGLTFLFGLGMAVFVVSILPLLGLIASTRLRRFLVLWVVGCTVPALALLYLGAEMRYVAGSIPLVGVANIFGCVLSSIPLILSASVPRWRRELAYAWAPLVLALVFGTSQQRRMDLSEQLLSAAQRGAGPEVRRLLSLGAGPDCWDLGRCAIDLATDRKDWTTVKALIDHGATDATYHTSEDPDSVGSGTMTSVAIEKGGRPDLAQRLRENGS